MANVFSVAPFTTAMAKVVTVLVRIKYKHWQFQLGVMENGCFLQVRFQEGDDVWRGRKWYISSHACRSEIVQTALLAVLLAEEHEAREKFLYKGKAVFGTHKDVDSLCAVSHQTRDDL